MVRLGRGQEWRGVCVPAVDLRNRDHESLGGLGSGGWVARGHPLVKWGVGPTPQNVLIPTLHHISRRGGGAGFLGGRVPTLGGGPWRGSRVGPVSSAATGASVSTVSVLGGTAADTVSSSTTSASSAVGGDWLALCPPPGASQRVPWTKQTILNSVGPPEPTQLTSCNSPQSLWRGTAVN